MRDAHRLLRDATRDAHDRLDALFAGFDLTLRDGYARFIGAQADAMLAVEGALDRAGAAAILPDWPDRRRGALLLSDARALGLPSPAPGRFDLDGTPAVAAALYVVEGSRHGARHLRRTIAPSLPSAFLDADQAPGNWSKLLDALDRLLYEDADRATAVAVADRVFDRFAAAGRSWMAKEAVWLTA